MEKSDLHTVPSHRFISGSIICFGLQQFVAVFRRSNKDSCAIVADTVTGLSGISRNCKKPNFSADHVTR